PASNGWSASPRSPSRSTATSRSAHTATATSPTSLASRSAGSCPGRSASPPAGGAGPMSRTGPRSLLIPPGIRAFLTRQRTLQPGPCLLEGRAWSGWGPIVEVEVSVDGGSTWGAAELADPPAPHAWQAWSYRWDALTPGYYELCCRATDAPGRSQPTRPQLNLG